MRLLALNPVRGSMFIVGERSSANSARSSMFKLATNTFHSWRSENRRARPSINIALLTEGRDKLSFADIKADKLKRVVNTTPGI